MTVHAPGRPGNTPLWTTSAKSGVGTALSMESPVWFTLARGILTEVYYPFVDTACIRDMELLVADGNGFFSEEKQDTRSEVHYLARGVPAFRLVNTCRQGRYRIEKEVLADPSRSVVLQQVHFVPLKGHLSDYSAFVLLSPDLSNHGAGNTAWVGDYKGIPMLFAWREGITLALACSTPWRQRSAGFVGVSDGWQDVSRHHRMEWTYEKAEGGNVALTGAVDLPACGGQFLLALAFGRNAGEAGHRARAGLLQGFEPARKRYLRVWSDWQRGLLSLAGSKKHPQDLYRISAAVMRIHEAKYFPGGIIASLSRFR
jgi:glucoamylase